MPVKPITRRRFLAACSAGTLAAWTGNAFAAIRKEGRRELGFYNLHTGESLQTAYCVDGGYCAEALADINHILRDFRTGDVHPIDPGLLDLIYSLHQKLGSKAPYHVISGFRSPKTNAMLCGKSNGVAKKSLHMQGMAVDVRLPDVPLKTLRNTALAMKRGGVGYYPQSNFVHLDVGRVRFW